MIGDKVFFEYEEWVILSLMADGYVLGRDSDYGVNDIRVYVKKTDLISIVLAKYTDS